jgi:hypothetical protein
MEREAGFTRGSALLHPWLLSRRPCGACVHLEVVANAGRLKAGHLARHCPVRESNFIRGGGKRLLCPAGRAAYTFPAVSRDPDCI